MTAADTASNTEPPNLSRPTLTSFFGLNLIVLVVLGLATSIWLLYYTDTFPEVAGILALGGAATWVGFVLKLLGQRRIDELQAWSDSAILNRSGTVIILALLMMGLLVAGNFRGGIQLEPLQESVEHTVQIHAVGKSSSDLAQLQPSGHLRWTGWTCWWSPGKMAVKVSGYPEAAFEFMPWQRLSIYVPNSLLRPVVLLRPSVALIDSVRDTSTSLELIIKDAGRPIARPRAPFDGHAVWIGGDPDILVPQETEMAWRQELVTLNSIKHLDFWLPPLAPSQFNAPIQPGQEIQATLWKRDNTVYTVINFKVRPLRSSREFVQEVVLDVPSSSP